MALADVANTDLAGESRRVRAFVWLVAISAVAGIGLLALLNPGAVEPVLLIWILLVAAAEFLPVPAWGNLQVSLTLPLLLTVGILYTPAAAGLTAFIGSADPREFRGQITLPHALFNRAQVAWSVLAASAAFHLVARHGVVEGLPAWRLILAAVLAAGVDYVINSGLVSAYVSLRTGVRPHRVVRELRIGNLVEFLVSYLGLGVLGLTLAVLFARVGFWALPAFFVPLIFARLMYLRSQALEVAHEELQAREQLLRQLSNTMAEERADERLQIASYLHDDLAQILFRLSIQVDVARKMLEKRDLEHLAHQLEKIRGSKQETSDRVRALIRDLHRSPLGAKGLAEALESFTDEVGRDSGVVFHRDVQEMELPAPIALLIYHIAREGVMNALKHAEASDIRISVVRDSDHIVLELEDNGRGFDVHAPGPEGHYGMAMMRERAQVGGGLFEVSSDFGRGTRITVRFPVALLQGDATAELDARWRGEGSRSASAEPSPIQNADGRATVDQTDEAPEWQVQ
jgi:signal transduction histidine kinase